MTETPQPPKEAAFFTTIRGWGLTRGENGVVGGVVEGLGQRVGMAAVPARLITVLAGIVFTGLVLIGYAAAWALLPDRRGNIIIQNFGRGVTNVGALLGIAVLTLFGFAALDGGLLRPWAWDNDGPFGANWGGGATGRVGDVLGVFAVLIPLAVVTGLAVLVIWLVRRSKNPPRPPAPAHPSETGAPDSDGDHATTADARATTAPGSPSAPQPWEPALLPGDPRAGATASRGAAAGLATTASLQHDPAHDVPPLSDGGQPSPAHASAAPAPQYYAPAAPPAPPRPRVPGPGKGGYLGFLGVLIVSMAIVAGLERAGELAVSPVLAWGACITVGLGAILVIVALAGRKLGFLGFLSVIAVLLSVAFAANAQEVRENYDGAWGWWDNAAWVDESTGSGWSEAESVPTPGPEPSGVDLSADLADDYASIFVSGTCESPLTLESWDDLEEYGDSVATMRLGAVTTDLELDLVSAYNRVAVPAGTSIEILGSGSTTVVWSDRDIQCSSWNEPAYDEFGDALGTERHSVLAATNPDAPVLTLTTAADSVTYLEEVVE